MVSEEILAIARDPDRFVRVPTQLLEALLRARLSGGQWRVLLWVMRNTYGWNRQSTPFTWYRIARDLGLSRPATYRGGQDLLKAQILVVRENQLAVEVNCAQWDLARSGAAAQSARQLWLPALGVAMAQRPTLPQDNATVAGGQRGRCRNATLYRAAKDSSKDNSKTYIDTERNAEIAANGKRRHLAGAAAPVPGKYDGLSQN